MAVKGGRGRGTGDRGHPAAALEGPPMVRPAVVAGRPEQGGEFRGVDPGRLTVIGEGQGAAPLAGEAAVDFHDREDRAEAGAIGQGEVDGFVAVGVLEHPCPVGGVKEGIAGKGEDARIPFGIAQGIDDVNRRSGDGRWEMGDGVTSGSESTTARRGDVDGLGVVR